MQLDQEYKDNNLFQSLGGLKKDCPGLQNYLATLYKVYGPYSTETLACLKLYSNNFSNFATNLVQTINRLKYSQQEHTPTSLIHEILIFFMEEKGVEQQDVIQLFQGFIHSDYSLKEVDSRYGMSQLYPEEMEYFEKLAKKIFDPWQGEERTSRQKDVEKIIKKMSSQLLSQFSINKKVIVRSSQQLKQNCALYKISVKKQSDLIHLYDTCQWLGPDHIQSQQLIQSTTQAGYRKRLNQLAHCIPLLEVQTRIDKELSWLFDALKLKGSYYKQNFQKVVESYYRNNGQLNFLSTERRLKVDEKICSVLSSLIQQIPEPFKAETVAKINVCASKIIDRELKNEQSIKIIKNIEVSSFSCNELQKEFQAVHHKLKVQDLKFPGDDSLKHKSPDLFASFANFSPELKDWSEVTPQLNSNTLISSFRVRLTDSLSMQNSFGDILKYMHKSKHHRQSPTPEGESQSLRKSLKGLINEQSQIQLTKKGSNRSLIRSSEKVVNIQNERQQESAWEEKNNMNPFNLPKQQCFFTQHNIRVVFIFISRGQVGKVELKRIFQVNKKQKISSINVISTNKKYKGIHITYATFQVPEIKSKYVVHLYQSLLGKIRREEWIVNLEIDTNKILNGNYFIMTQEELLISIEEQSLVIKAKHFSLLTCVKFILKTLVQQLKCPEEVVYTYLKFLYDHYNQPHNLQLLEHIVEELYISKTVPTLQSKYLLYLFYAIFQQNTLGNYLNTELYKKIRFQKGYIFSAPHERYSHLLVLQQFFNMAYIIDLLMNHPKDILLLTNAICLSMKTQRNENIYLLLHIVTYFGSVKLLQTLENQILRQFYNNSHLTAVEYFNTRLIYLSNHIITSDDNYNQNIKIIMAFLDDLITLCKKKTLNIKRKLQINCSCQISKIYHAVPHRSAPLNWVIFVNKLKQLKVLSQGYINLAGHIQNSFFFLLDRNRAVDYLKVLIKIPVANFDRMEAIKLLRDTSFCQSRMKSLIFQLIKQNTQNYCIQFFTELLNYFIQTRKIKQQQVQIMLCFLDKCAPSAKITSQNKYQLLIYIFKKYLFEANIKIQNSIQGTQRQQSIGIFRNYFNTIKTETLRVLVLQKTLKLIKGNELNLKQLFQEIFPDVTPKEDKVSNFGRRQLQRLYDKHFILKDQNRKTQILRPVSCDPALMKEQNIQQ